jgi:molybdopterin-guanine dinucleotide biosynthesis protein B
MAYFGPPAGSLSALLRHLPEVDLVLAEGWRGEKLPRVEVHRRRISREFLCAKDRNVIAVVTDEPPPRELPAFGADDVAGIGRFVTAWTQRPRPSDAPARAAAGRPASRR